ncbi:MAG: hypothetical protein WC229_00210 [Candidatus Paceibacterota bacterium]|jgi:hypothetical protein
MSFLNILPWVLLTIVSIIGFYKNQPRRLSELSGKERFVVASYESKKYFYVIVHRSLKIVVYKHKINKIASKEQPFLQEMKEGLYKFYDIGDGEIMVNLIG